MRVSCVFQPRANVSGSLSYYEDGWLHVMI
jgi:hypothetical protein